MLNSTPQLIAMPTPALIHDLSPYAKTCLLGEGISSSVYLYIRLASSPTALPFLCAVKHGAAKANASERDILLVIRQNTTSDNGGQKIMQLLG